MEMCKNFERGKQHNVKLCRYFHAERDFRRALDYSFVIDFQLLSKMNSSELMHQVMQLYRPDMCKYDEKTCPNGQACTLCHNRTELVYHPEKYKTKYCTRYPKRL